MELVLNMASCFESQFLGNWWRRPFSSNNRIVLRRFQKKPAQIVKPWIPKRALRWQRCVSARARAHTPILPHFIYLNSGELAPLTLRERKTMYSPANYSMLSLHLFFLAAYNKTWGCKHFWCSNIYFSSLTELPLRSTAFSTIKAGKESCTSYRLTNLSSKRL